MFRRFGNRVALDQNIFAAKFILRIASFRRVTVRLHSVVKFKHRRLIAERGVDLFIGPNIKRAFAVLGFPMFEKTVRIFGGKNSAFFRSHIADDVIQNIASHIGVLPILGNLKCIDVCARQLGLIVEHLFEMRDVPIAIDRVAMESAAKMIVHSPGGHFTKGDQIHLECVFP